MANRKKLSNNTILRLAQRDGVECIYCGEKKVSKLTIDHVLPLNKGGSNHINNLAICCFTCNQDKGHLLLTQFLRALEIEITPQLAQFL